MEQTRSLELAEIADSTSPLSERTQQMLERLHSIVPFDAAWLALADPMSSSYTSLASTDLDERTLQYLSGPEMAHDIEVTHTARGRPPLSPSDLPYPAAELPHGPSASSPPASTRPWASPCSTGGSGTSDTWRCSPAARSRRPWSCGAGCTNSPPSWRAGPTRCARSPWQHAW